MKEAPLCFHMIICSDRICPNTTPCILFVVIMKVVRRSSLLSFFLVCLYLRAVSCRTSHDYSTRTDASHSPKKPFRGKQLASPIDPLDLYQAYRDIQSDYQQKAFDRHDWKRLHQKDRVQVCLLEHPDDPTCPYIRLQGIFPVSVQECWNFLALSNWDNSMPKMDPFYEGVSRHGTYTHDDNVTMILCRKRTKRIMAFGKRDLVFVSVQENEPLPDGTWVSGTVSVQSDLLPRQSGYVRAFQDSIAFYKPLDGNTKTELTILCRIDLNDSGEDGTGGFIPMWLYVKTIGTTGVQSVIRMRNALLEEKRASENGP